MFNRIKYLEKSGFTQMEISMETGLDRKTVRKYLKMNEKEFAKYLDKIHYRTKCFDPFKKCILEVYENNEPDIPYKSAVYDYLEEVNDKLPGTERTFRYYIDYLIETEQLKFNKKFRPYHPVPEMEYGKQMQLDFGVHKTRDGVKFYIFAVVLSSSRYKYCALQGKPFTTLDVIYHLLDCFQYFGGLPEELVIDQDSTLVVSENHGDIIYTKDFSSFLDEMKLKMFVCRKADPESKGKIENLVKFVKHNFLKVRDFTSIEEAQKGLRKWLVRRANGKISMATRKVPAIMFKEEKKHLKPLRNSIYLKDLTKIREERKVDKMCQISVNSSKYPVPEKYRNGVVEIYKTEENLFIYDPKTEEQVSEYTLSLIPGTRVYDCRLNDKKKEKIKKLKKELACWYQFPEWNDFVGKNEETYPRYFRDQYQLAFKKLKDNIESNILKKALKFCIDSKTYSMNDLYDTYCYFKRDDKEVNIPSLSSHIKYHGSRGNHSRDFNVSTRGLSVYQQIISSEEVGI